MRNWRAVVLAGLALPFQVVLAEEKSNFVEPADVPKNVRELVEQGHGVTVKADGKVVTGSSEPPNIRVEAEDDGGHSVGFATAFGCILEYWSCDPPHNRMLTRLLPGEVHYYRKWNSRRQECSGLKVYKCPDLVPFVDQKSYLENRLDLLRARSDALFEELLEIQEARGVLRKQLFDDLGCECDSNFCHTEKRQEPISAGEEDVFCHDDQDRGNVAVHCVSGSVEVVISTAVWNTFEEYDRKTLTAGQSWNRDITEQSSWYDQTNRVQVFGKSDGSYNLDFRSWDN